MKVRNNLRDRDHSSGYRQALRDVVAAIVQNDEAATVATVNARLPSTVAAPDQAHFTQLVLQEFAASHPGNAERFGTDPWRLPRGRKGMVGRVDVLVWQWCAWVRGVVLANARVCKELPGFNSLFDSVLRIWYKG